MIETMQVTVDAAGWPSAVVAAWCGGLATNDEHGARVAIGSGTIYAYPGDYVIRGVVRLEPCTHPAPDHPARSARGPDGGGR